MIYIPFFKIILGDNLYFERSFSMSHYIMKTTEQWDAVSMNNYIIPRGTICVEIVSKELMKLKIGDGTRVYHKLPYLPRINEIDLSAYYTKTEIDALIQNIGSELSQYYTKTEIDQIIQNINVDLSDYAKISYVDAHTHTHDNQSVLDQITAPFTVDDKTKLDSIHVKDYDTQIQELQSKSHSHENQDVLDQITQTHVDEWHTHSNQLILDDITASFTVDDKTKLDSLSVYDVFEGASAYEGGNIGLVPAPEEGDQDKFLRGDGTWGTVSSLGGYATEQYVDDAIAAIPEYTLPIASDEILGGVKIGDNIDINDGVISVTFPEETEYIDGTDIEIIDNGDGTKTVNYVGEDKDTTYTGGDGINIIPQNCEIYENKYCVLEYLETEYVNGRSVMFNLGHQLQPDEDVELTIQNKGQTDETFCAMLTSRCDNGSTATRTFQIDINHGATPQNISFYRCDVGANGNYGGYFFTPDDVYQKFTYITHGTTLNIYDENGELLGTIESPHAVTLSTYDNLKLFICYNGYNNRYHDRAQGKFYELIIRNGDNIVKHFVPVVNTDTSEIGIYEIITQTFISCMDDPNNAKTGGNLTSGPFKRLPLSDVSDYIVNVTPATKTEIGGVIIGDNINVDNSGVISVDLPKPSSFYTPGDGISIGNVTLSEDFEYLSFIQFNGGTVFDTGEIHKAHDKFEIDFECTNINGDTLFDSRSYNVEANTYGVHILDNGVVYLNRSSPSYAPVYDNSFKLELNGQYKLITQDMTMSIYDYETNELLEETSTAPSDMFLDDGLYTMTLGNIHNRAHYHHSNGFGYYKLFRFKWYRDNELLHDFIPARRNTDNVVGLYDSVTGTMITPGYQNSAVPMTYGTIIDPDSLIDFSINVTPATTTEIGGIIVGRGLTIDEDGVLDVEFPEYNNTTYEAGSGISIQEADHLASLGYRRLDYIDSNGQQYIDTGFVPSNNTTIVIDSIPHTAGHSITNNLTLFGTMLNNAYNADEWMFWCYSGGSEEYQNQGCPGIYCRGQNNAITLTGVNFETRCTITASTSHRNITIDYPDGTSITRSPANTNAFSTPVNTLYIFHSNTESVPVPLRKTYTRMYSCQIFDNNALLMDLIPAQRISDDKVGMYDIQNDQFYTSQTDVEFIAGNAHEGSVNNQISITPATTTAIGGVIIGEGINVTQDGTISVDQSIIPDVPEELGVMDLQVKQNEVGVLTSTKPNNVTEDLDVLQYLGVLTLNVGFAPGNEVPLG